MADFPTNPTKGATVTDGVRTWTWTGVTWDLGVGALLCFNDPATITTVLTAATVFPTIPPTIVSYV